MKKVKIFLTLLASVGLALSLSVQSSKADTSANYQVNTQYLVRILEVSVPLDVINWKVGDTAEYSVTAGSFGNLGKMVKSVTKDEGTSIWMRQDMNLSVQKEVVDVQISKADGKILKMIRNGQEQQIPDDKIEIISQDYTEITVPAGKFEALHVVAKTKQVSKLEVWANPRDTVMEGTLKQVMATSLTDIALELLSFKKGS